MRDIVGYGQRESFRSPTPSGFGSERRGGWQLRSPLRSERKRLEDRAELQAEMGRLRLQTLTEVGGAAMAAQSLISSRARLLIEGEPSAVHGVAYISQVTMLALGDVVEQTKREVCR